MLLTGAPLLPLACLILRHDIGREATARADLDARLARPLSNRLGPLTVGASAGRSATPRPGAPAANTPSHGGERAEAVAELFHMLVAQVDLVVPTVD